MKRVFKYVHLQIADNIHLSFSSDINSLVYLFTFFSIEAKAPVALQKQSVNVYQVYNSNLI